MDTMRSSGVNVDARVQRSRDESGMAVGALATANASEVLPWLGVIVGYRVGDGFGVAVLGTSVHASASTGLEVLVTLGMGVG